MKHRHLSPICISFTSPILPSPLSSSSSTISAKAIREYDTKLLATGLGMHPNRPHAVTKPNFQYRTVRAAQDPETGALNPDAQLPSWVFTPSLSQSDEAKAWIASKAGKPLKVGSLFHSSNMFWGGAPLIVCGGVDDCLVTCIAYEHCYRSDLASPIFSAGMHVTRHQIFVQQARVVSLQVESITETPNNFIVEPFLSCPALPRQHRVPRLHHLPVRRRLTFFTHEGVVDLGVVDAKALVLNIPVPEEKANFVDFIARLYSVYVDLHFAYLEIIPLVVLDAVDSDRGVHLWAKWVIARDSTVYDAAAAKSAEVNTDRGLPIVWPAPFGRDLTKEEAYIQKLDASTCASLKLAVLTSQGRIWTMITGGGAPIVYSDAIAANGFAHEPAHYGEYSGAQDYHRPHHLCKWTECSSRGGFDIDIDVSRLLLLPSILPSSTITMQGVSLLECSIPSNPDIAGIGVRIAIYIQNLLCFIPALWALWDGKVTDYELDSTDSYSTTNLFLAFAILISCIVQALTIGVSSYHASIVLSLSWMNNTSVFVYFLLYVQYRGQEDIKPKLTAWVNHIKRQAYGMFRLPDGSHRVSAKYAYKVLVQRITLVLGSLHLCLMAALGIWLWSAPQSLGKDKGSRCAFDVAELAILGISVPFRKEGLRVFSLILYSLFLIPGLNLLLPVGVFLSVYCLASRQRRSLSDLPTSRALPTLPPTHGHIEMRPLPNRGSTSTANHPSTASLLTAVEPRALLNDPEMQTQTFDPQLEGRIAKLRQVIPVGIGLLILLCINIIFIVDIELTLRQNRGYQDSANSDEAEWGFGQILAMVLVFMPLRDLGESIIRRRHELQTKLNESLMRAIKLKDVEQISRWVNAGAEVSVQGDDGQTALDVAFSREDQHQLISLLIEKGMVLNEVLAEAIHSRNLGHISGCVKYGVDVNLEAHDGMTALEVTILEREWVLVRSIVEAGADVNQRCGPGEYSKTAALREAYGEGAPTSILELMLEKGADPNTQAGYSKNTCLHEACNEGREEVVSLLLKYGANPDIQASAAKAPESSMLSMRLLLPGRTAPRSFSPLGLKSIPPIPQVLAVDGGKLEQNSPLRISRFPKSPEPPIEKVEFLESWVNGAVGDWTVPWRSEELVPPKHWRMARDAAVEVARVPSMSIVDPIHVVLSEASRGVDQGFDLALNTHW
ncbi:hypothetical protein NMY22_g10093 [Coprinellus aureogranulatus]|nr:hypothetical protein NMY22_g10093 [Coprinellus aureogranulatus]